MAIDTLKIKEMFSKLQNNKIDQVQKIINDSDSKPKLWINMITKGPSCKQVIVSMNSEAVGRFLKDSSMHIININHALKNIKLKIMVDFIYVKDKGIVISTNNIALSLDLQEIEKYIKSLLANDSD